MDLLGISSVRSNGQISIFLLWVLLDVLGVTAFGNTKEWCKSLDINSFLSSFCPPLTKKKPFNSLSYISGNFKN